LCKAADWNGRRHAWFPGDRHRKRNSSIKLKSIVFAAGLIAVPALAFAQSSPSPINQSGPGVTGTNQAPTEMGAAAVTGQTKAVPASKRTGSKMKMGKRSKAAPTTGSNVRERQQRNASPASGAEGAEKVK
jgi:hypothetical protein